MYSSEHKALHKQNLYGAYGFLAVLIEIGPNQKIRAGKFVNGFPNVCNCYSYVVRGHNMNGSDN